MADPTGQVNNFSRWHRHEVQSVSGKNLGVTLGGDWTDVLQIDSRVHKETAITVYNQDGADTCQIRVIGTLLDNSNSQPDEDDVSWVTKVGEEVYPITDLPPGTLSELIRGSGSYTFIKVQGRTSDSVLLNGYYRGVN